MKIYFTFRENEQELLFQMQKLFIIYDILVSMKKSSTTFIYHIALP